MKWYMNIIMDLIVHNRELFLELAYNVEHNDDNDINARAISILYFNNRNLFDYYVKTSEKVIGSRYECEKWYNKIIKRIRNV